MRFTNCPNCLSSHSDYADRESTTDGPHRKRSRLHTLTKALFSPARASFSGNKSKNFKSTSQNTTNKHFETESPRWLAIHSKYRLERKHKVKKRDLVKQHRNIEKIDQGIGTTYSGNLLPRRKKKTVFFCVIEVIEYNNELKRQKN